MSHHILPPVWLAMKIVVPIALFLLLIVSPSTTPKSYADEITTQQAEYFEKKIRPLLHKHCFECHAADAKTLQGGLRLDSRAGVLRGGDSGPAVVPGEPAASLLVSSINYDDDSYQMPPQGKLAAHEIAELTRWVERGAPFPKSADESTMQKAEIDFAAGRQHWSFQPVKTQPLPKVNDTSWPRQRIDRFVLSAIERVRLTPSQEAERATLIRRLSFDLTGLPPSPQAIVTFVNDDSPDAYDRLVSRLLNSPRFGERWARHWLDLARYTDETASWLNSTGQAHLYRDWVVNALNDDVPYSEFVRRQLATDMIDETGPDDLPALGFVGLSPTYWKELQLPMEIIKVIVADEWEERVDAVSRTFLGLTVACARCHDHKFDPISTEDYYAIAGVFASSRLSEKPIIDEQKYAPAKKAKEEVERLTKEIAKLKKQKPMPAEEIKKHETQIAELRKTPHFNTPTANVVSDESLYVVRKGETMQSGSKIEYKPKPRDLHLFIRGNPNRLGDVVPRRFLTVLASKESKPFRHGSGRLELASAITNDARPLTARVIVNRIWREHFGAGLVATPSNFGKLGSKPTHPELLDDLTARFIAHGWSLKWLHREIVTSATYRQQSTIDSEQRQRDPDNRWLARMNRRRLGVESWRDSMLVAGGDFDGVMGGPSIKLDDPANNRRTLYTKIHRRDMSKVLQIHDFPDPIAHSPQRTPTTTPLQGLYLLNSPFIANRATALATRLSNDVPGDTRAQIEQAHRLLFAREATEHEIALGLNYLAEHANDHTSIAWQQYAHALLGCNEFLFVD